MTFQPISAGEYTINTAGAKTILLLIVLFESGPVDFGHFVTAMTVVTGFALPLVLGNAGVITKAACWMSMSGGVLVYGTSQSKFLPLSKRYFLVSDL